MEKAILYQEPKLKVKYKIPSKVDKKLDKTIERVFKKLGWKWEGSGYDFYTQERDLDFYKIKGRLNSKHIETNRYAIS